MLKKETLQLLATLTKTKLETLEAAIKDEKEVDIEIPADLTVLTKEELDTRDEAQKNVGIKAGKEIGLKEVKKAAGISDTEVSIKDPAKVAQAIIDKATTDAKVKPDEKVTQLTEQVTLLQRQLTEKDTEITTAKNIAATVQLDTKILTSFPKERTSMLTDGQYLTLLKSEHSFKEVDGVIIVEKDGKPLRDAKTTNPLPLDQAITSIFTERKWIDAAGGAGAGGGRGTGDKGGGGAFTKKSQVVAKYEAEGKNLNGSDGQALVAELASLKKADPTFDMEN
jgi:hypothetical protein